MSKLVAPLALLIAFVSLALNVTLITRLNQARAGAVQTLDHVSARLDDLKAVQFEQNLRVTQDFTVAGELPFRQDLVVPISTSIPVSTTAHASVLTPFGAIDVPVNVNTSVPVNLQVPVTISRTVPYSFTIPIDLQVPIQVRLRDLNIDPAIKEAQDEMLRLKRSLE